MEASRLTGFATRTLEDWKLRHADLYAGLAAAADLQRTLPVARVDATLPYLAGFFDADGAVMITRPRDHAQQVLVSASQVVREPLDALATCFGGKVALRQRPKHVANSRPIFEWRISDRRAAAFLHATLPHLIVKHERAALALCFMDLGRVPSGDQQRGARIRSERARLCDEMTALNRRGLPEVA